MLGAGVDEGLLTVEEDRHPLALLDDANRSLTAADESLGSSGLVTRELAREGYLFVGQFDREIGLLVGKLTRKCCILVCKLDSDRRGLFGVVHPLCVEGKGADDAHGSCQD